MLAFYHHRIADQGIYGNSIIANRSRHENYSQMLRNEWLRTDLANASVGGGTFGSLRHAVERLHWAESDLTNLLRHLQWTVDNLGSRLEHALHRIDEINIQLGSKARVRRPVRNSFRLVYFWLSSGKPLYYIAQTFRWIRDYGWRATLDRVKLWLTVKGEAFPGGASGNVKKFVPARTLVIHVKLKKLISLLSRRGWRHHGR